GVTLDNTLHLLARIRRFSVPCALEVSNLHAVTPGFDTYFIPSVLNSRDMNWVIGYHHEAAKQFADVVNWPDVVGEGYCVLNGESKVSRLTNARTSLSVAD